jgi:cystine transport system permease protein
MSREWDLFWSSFGPLALETIRGTIPLALVTFALGLAIALGLALMRLYGNRLVSGIARFYISVVRGTPCSRRGRARSSPCR